MDIQMSLTKRLFLAAGLVIATGNVFAAEIETAKGKIEIATRPARVAAYDIAAIDTLNALGVKIDGVPEKLYVPRLESLKERGEVVGTIFEPDLEALSALAPELIIVGGRSSPQLDMTKQVAASIDMTMDDTNLVEQAKARLKAYGMLFGKEAEAKAASEELDEEVEAARTAVNDKGNALIIMTSGPKISAYGKGSRFGWLHTALALPFAVENVEAATHGEAVSFEFIKKANPDWLIVLDRSAAIGSGEQGARTTLDNELVAGTTAWKKGQVIYLPAADFYIAAGGSQATREVLARITEAFSKAQ